MKVGSVDLEREVLLVAEIGNNHEGDPRLALELVQAAAESGAGAVKVQVIRPDRLVNRSQAARIKQLSRFRLPHSVFADLAAAANAKGVLFMASAFDEQSLDEISDLVAAVKIASGDLDFWPLLARAARLGKPIFLSTGTWSLPEINVAVNEIARHLPREQSLSSRLALLHCVSMYPTPLQEANLRAIQTLRAEFGLTVGYSDHTLGIEAALLALALGSRIIEKHFTLDKKRDSFRDHALSADPEDLRRLAAITRNADAILGNGEKRPSPAELESAATMRRCIVAARDLALGDRLALADLEYVRPMGGLPPSAAQRLVGRRLRVPLKAHEVILESHFE
ncbi:MAG: hypothetical protein FJ398_01635 [Verrucomicrobia bacterium]|nr:hypothetical protein [Verrucomicrobiota bacterium]